MIARFPHYVRALLDRRRLDREMRDAMAAHLAQATERFVARGLSRADAARAARREFGNVGVLEEQARDARGPWCRPDHRGANRGAKCQETGILGKNSSSPAP